MNEILKVDIYEKVDIYDNYINDKCDVFITLTCPYCDWFVIYDKDSHGVEAEKNLFRGFFNHVNEEHGGIK